MPTPQHVPAGHGAVTVYRAPERFDAYVVEDFLGAAHVCPSDLHVDLGAVRFIDSAALSALLAARIELIERGAELWLADISITARTTFELAGLAEALPPAPDRTMESR